MVLVIIAQVYWVLTTCQVPFKALDMLCPLMPVEASGYENAWHVVSNRYAVVGTPNLEV